MVPSQAPQEAVALGDSHAAEANGSRFRRDRGCYVQFVMSRTRMRGTCILNLKAGSHGHFVSFCTDLSSRIPFVLQDDQNASTMLHVDMTLLLIVAKI